MTTRSPQLDYEPSTRAHRRNSLRRWLLVLATVFVTASLWWQGPAAYRRLQLAYWLHRVATFTAPADRVVYEEDPARWPALLARPGYRTMPVESFGWSPFVAYLAPPVERLSQLRTTATAGATVLFAHHRRSPDGRDRLVIVWLAYNGVRCNAQGATPDNQVRLDLRTTVLDGTTVLRDDGHSPWVAPTSVAQDRQSPLYARIFAGQPDAADPARFTIPFQIGDHADTLDGHLRNDGRILLRPRNLDHPLNPK